MNPVIRIALLLMLSTSFAKTANWEAFFAKLDKAYRSGDYKAGRKLLLDNRGNITAEAGTDSYLNARAYCFEAKFMMAVDKFLDWQTNIDAANKLLNKTPDTNFNEFAKALEDLADAYMAYDEYAKAEAVLSRVKKLIDDQKIKDPFTIAKYEYYNIRSILSQGYFNRTIAQVENALVKAQAQIVKKEERTDLKGKTAIVTLSKEEVAQRKAIYAELKLMQGLAHLENGESSAALGMFNSTAEWVKKNAGGVDGSLAMAYYYMGLINIDEDNLKDANSNLQQAEAASLKYYKRSAENYIRIQEALIPVLKKLEKHKEAQTKNNAMDANINDYYGRKGYHYQRNKISDIRRDLINENFTRAIRDLNELSSQGDLIPKNHLFRATIAEILYYVYLRQNQYDLAYSNLQELIRLKKDKYGESAPVYHAALLKLAEYDYLYLDDFKNAEAIFNQSLEVVIRKETSKKSKNFFNYLYLEIGLYEITDRYERAYKLMKEAHAESERIYASNSIQYATSEARYAQLDVTAGNYLEAEKKLTHSETIFKSAKGNYYQPYASMLETKAALLIIQGQYEQADDALDKSNSYLKKMEDGSDYHLASNMEEKALIDMYFGKYKDTEEELRSLLAGREKKFGSKSRSLIVPLQLMALLKITTGDFIEAEKNATRALNICKEIFGPNSVRYAENLNVFTRLYASVGDYDKAEQSSQTSFDILKTALGYNHIKSSLAENELALMKVYNDKPADEIAPLFKEALATTQKIVGADNPLYAEILENAAFFYVKSNEYGKADEAITKAISIWENRLGSTNIHAAKLYRIKGDVSFARKNFKDAKENYLKSKSLFASIFDDNHAEYIQSLGLAARMHFILGESKNANAAAEETVDKSLVYLKKVFPALSERGKALFWEKVKEDFEFYKTLTFSNVSASDAMVSKVFDISLQTKAILLNSSIKVREKILKSGDTTLINSFNVWQIKREELTSALAQSAAQRKESGVDIQKLENEIEALEKKLSQSSSVFAENNNEEIELSWTKVKEVLTDKEVALEFTAFRKFAQGFSDTVWYAVMAINNDTKGAPEYILIKNGKEIDGKFLKYYRNCVKADVEDEYSYDKYWKPLIPLIKKGKETVYLSMDGVYNQINLETIKTSDGYLLNQYDLSLISSSRDLVEKRSLAKGKKKVAAATPKGIIKLFGNPTYYPENWESQQFMKQLPGAEEEVREVNNILKSKNLTTQLFVENEATEESIKKLSSPLVLHIATHGFFMASKNKTAEETIDPLLNSGLVMRNGGGILNNSKGYELNKQEGVLTAKEAMNLNLDSTSLVVMSACETGLGEVALGEGVYGLQRSLLVAGADNVIMSLFKVNDEATRDLMIEFYKRWSETGEKKKSLVAAKKAIQEKYKSPKYWGAFLMVGLE